MVLKLRNALEQIRHGLREGFIKLDLEISVVTDLNGTLVMAWVVLRGLLKTRHEESM